MLLIESTEALGSLQKKSYSELKPGEIVEFTVLFWNSEELPITVNLSVKNKPRDWLVFIEPSEFTLTKNINSSEVVSLPNGYVNAMPVKVLIIPPEDEESDVYQVTLWMVAGRKERGISFFQEKNFNFEINFTGTKRKEFVHKTTTLPIKEAENFTIPKSKVERIREGYPRIFFFSVIVILSLFASWVIYRL
jgi:hypothetical protein